MPSRTFAFFGKLFYPDLMDKKVLTNKNEDEVELYHLSDRDFVTDKTLSEW